MFCCVVTTRGNHDIIMIKWMIQLAVVAMDIDMGLAKWLQSSAVRNHGMVATPRANMMM